MGTTPPPPPARRDDVADVLHGVEVPDPYRWLEDGDSPETAAWVAAQNERTRAVLDGLPTRGSIHTRLVELLRVRTSAAPRVCGDRLFSLDRWGDYDQAVVVQRSVDDPSVARVVLDPNDLTADRTAAIDWFHPSPDGRLVAYGVSEGGDERSTLRVLDVDNGAVLPDVIPDTRAASVAWLPDGSAFGYTRYPPGEEYGRHVRWHVLGTDVDGDEVVFDDAPDPTAWPDVSISRDGRWLLVHVALGWSRIDVHLIERATGARTTLIEGVEAISLLDVVGDRLYGTTTLDAPRGRVVTAGLDRPDASSWQTLVPEGDGVVELAAVSGDSLLVASTRSAVASLRRYGRDGSLRTEIALPEAGSLAGFDVDEERELAVLSFTSFTRPAALLRWAPDAGLQPWSEAETMLDPATFEVDQVRYRSTDGTEIPMFLVRRAGNATSPDTPAILTGYGGFAVANTPVFGPHVAAWCEAGGLFAVACIRGGAEEGEAWHQAGMRERKQQVFDDFHTAGDWLVEQGWTSRDRLALRGGSNGGLLMGVALTQRPDLARAVHCAVPLLDMVRYHLFLIAKLWIPEYGDPDVAEEFAWLHAYSPYHHVGDGTCYPAVLFTTAESDSRVDPSHARKMAARLQEATSCGDERPVLLRVESRAGHGQGKPVTKQADELADVLAFLSWQLEGPFEQQT